MELYKACCGKFISLTDAVALIADKSGADCIVDAIFGTGFKGQIPASLIPLADALTTSDALKISIDVPLGVDADTGAVYEHALKADITVVLSFMKAGLVSYPAKEYVGKTV